MKKPPDQLLPLSASLLLLLLLLARPASNCRLSEFECRRSAACVALDRYCDGRDDCGDRSDEPEGCTREYMYLSS